MSSEDEFNHPSASAQYLPSEPSTSGINVSSPYGTQGRSSQPLSGAGAAPAGRQGQGQGQEYDKPVPGKGYAGADDPFGDEEEPSPYSFSNPQSGPYARSKQGRIAKFREDHLTDVDWTLGLNKLLRRKSKFEGLPREIALNDPGANTVKGYEKNSVSTGKYGPITFLPKFLYCKSPLLRGLQAELTDSRVFQICESVLLVHCHHPAGAERIAHGSIYDHRTSRRRFDCECLQGGARGSCKSQLISIIVLYLRLSS